MNMFYRAAVVSILLAAACGDDGGASSQPDASTAPAPFAIGGWWEVEVEEYSNWTTATLRFPLRVEQEGALISLCGSTYFGEFAPDTVRVPLAVGGQATLLLSIVDENQLVGTITDGGSEQTLTWRRMTDGPDGEFALSGSVLDNTVSIANNNAYGFVASFGDELYLDLRTPFCSQRLDDAYDDAPVGEGMLFELALGVSPQINTPYQVGGDLLFLNIEDQGGLLRSGTEGAAFSNRDIIGGTITFSEFTNTEGGRVSGTLEATLREPGNSLSGSFSFSQTTRWGFSFLGPEVDQDNLSFVFGGTESTLPNINDTQVAQVFTAGDSGGLVRVDLSLAQSQAGGDLRIGIRPAPLGIPDPSDASELASVTIADNILLRAPERYDVILEQAVPLVAGESYAITIETTGGEYLLHSAPGDSYFAGALYGRNAAGEAWVVQAPDADLIFRTHLLY